jgi:hypothetical protein
MNTAGEFRKEGKRRERWMRNLKKEKQSYVKNGK